MTTVANEIKEIASNDNIVILRKPLGADRYAVVSAESAFNDIREDIRWGSDDYVEDEEALHDFLSKCKYLITWRRTNTYKYVFLNADFIGNKELVAKPAKVDNFYRFGEHDNLDDYL